MQSSSRRRSGIALALVLAVLGWARMPAPAGAQEAPMPMAYTHDGNVYLLGGGGAARRAITTDGGLFNPARPGLGGIYYPWYQWSSDGHYLLLVRLDTALGDSLLLMKAGDTRPRLLAARVGQGDFYPAWALDGDRIVYEAAGTYLGDGLYRHTVATMDLNGHTRQAWRYTSLEGCGGGTPVVSEQLLDGEVGFGDDQPSMQWLIGRHVAVYSASCSGGLNVTDTRTGRTQRLDQKGMTWSEAVLAPRGTLAVRSDTEVAGTLVHSVLITTPRAGAPFTLVAPGELPAWSRDGRTLYFVRRTLTHMLHFVHPLGNDYDAPVMRTAIGRARADGTGATLLLQQDAFGFGPLHSTADGGALIFSSVDNMTGLSRHLQPNNSYTAALLRAYGPQVRIQRYTIGGATTTLVRQAGQPAV